RPHRGSCSVNCLRSAEALLGPASARGQPPGGRPADLGGTLGGSAVLRASAIRDAPVQFARLAQVSGHPSGAAAELTEVARASRQRINTQPTRKRPASDAWPTAPDERWTADYGALGVDGLSVDLS